MDAGRIDTGGNTALINTDKNIPIAENSSESEETFTVSGQKFTLEEKSSISINLSERDQNTLNSLEKALAFAQDIPEKRAEQEAEFNRKYINALRERLRLYQNMGFIADSQNFLDISREALRIARQTLGSMDKTLGPRLDNPRLLETLIQTDRDGAKAKITFNTFVPVKD